MFKDFKAFILRGNVVDLAVAITVGVAFTAVITALVKDFITPLMGAIGGKTQFQNLFFTVHHSKFLYGDFVNQVVSFLIIATAVFFLVVMPLTHLVKRLNLLPPEKPAPATKDCPHCLSAIPEAATRCAFCTSEL